MTFSQEKDCLFQDSAGAIPTRDFYSVSGLYKFTTQGRCQRFLFIHPSVGNRPALSRIARALSLQEIFTDPIRTTGKNMAYCCPGPEIPNIAI